MALIWGINYSVVKGGISSLEPFAFNGLRVALASLVLLSLSWWWRRDRWPVRNDLTRLALLGLLGNGVYQTLFILGMARTRAGIAALVVAAGPAYVAIVSHLLGRERLPSRAWLGIGVQLLGVVCVVASTQSLEADRTALVGTALITCGSVVWALFSVLLQPYTTRVHPIHLSAITMTSGATLLLLLALPALRRLDPSTITWAHSGAMVYAGVGALVIAYLLFYRGVRVLGPTRTSMYGNLQPVIAIAFAWLTLHEQPTRWQWIGTLLILAGLLLSRVTSNVAVSRASVTTAAEPAHG